MSDVFSNYRFWPIKSSKAGSLVANGEVLVRGTVVIKFTISNGKHGLWPQVPQDKVADNTKPGGFAYYPKVKFPDEAVYAEFQKLTVEEYQKSQSSAPAPSSQDTGNDPGNQDYDDVPF